MSDYERGKRDEQDWWIKATGRWSVFWIVVLVVYVLYAMGTGRL